MADTREVTHIVFRRTTAGPEIVMRCADNSEIAVHQKHVYHSPTGMEWGYGGSGPADAALNILAHFVDDHKAFALHQEFKWQFIAPLPYAGGTIPVSEILNWLLVQQAAQEEGAAHA